MIQNTITHLLKSGTISESFPFCKRIQEGFAIKKFRNVDTDASNFHYYSHIHREVSVSS